VKKPPLFFSWNERVKKRGRAVMPMSQSIISLTAVRQRGERNHFAVRPQMRDSRRGSRRASLDGSRAVDRLLGFCILKPIKRKINSPFEPRRYRRHHERS